MNSDHAQTLEEMAAFYRRASANAVNAPRDYVPLQDEIDREREESKRIPEALDAGAAALRQQEQELPSIEVTRQAIIDALVKGQVLGAREAVDRLIAAVRAEAQSASSVPETPAITQAVEQLKKFGLFLAQEFNGMKEGEWRCPMIGTDAAVSTVESIALILAAFAQGREQTQSPAITQAKDNLDAALVMILQCGEGDSRFTIDELLATFKARRDALIAAALAQGRAERHECEAWAMEGIGCAHCNPASPRAWQERAEAAEARLASLDPPPGSPVVSALPQEQEASPIKEQS